MDGNEVQGYTVYGDINIERKEVAVMVVFVDKV